MRFAACHEQRRLRARHGMDDRSPLARRNGRGGAPWAYPLWWERVRAVFGLAALNALIGVLLAILVGVVLFLFVLAFEMAISS
jgi:hypothetical protein